MNRIIAAATQNTVLLPDPELFSVEEAGLYVGWEGPPEIPPGVLLRVDVPAGFFTTGSISSAGLHAFTVGALAILV